MIADLKAAFQLAFRNTVSQFDLAELNLKTLQIEFKTGSNINPAALANLGYQWTGTCAITNLHPYFGPAI